MNALPRPILLASLFAAAFVAHTVALQAQPLSWERLNAPQGGTAWCVAQTGTGAMLVGGVGSLVRLRFPASIWQRASIDIGTSLVSDIVNETGRPLLACVRKGPMGQTVGLFQSTDDGRTWQRFQPELDRELNVAVYSPNSGLVVGGHNDDLYCRAPDETAWRHVLIAPLFGSSAPVDVRSIVVDRSGVIFAASSAGIVRSLDSGATWSASTPMSTIMSLAVAPDGSVFAAGTAQLLVTSDHGATWTDAPNFSDAVTMSCITPAGTMLGTIGDSIYASPDLGTTWVFVAPNSPLGRVVRIVPTGGHAVMAGTTCGPITSGDDGNHWGTRSLLFSATCISRFARDSSAGIYVADAEVGLARSTDNGDRWQLISPVASNFAGIAALEADGVRNLYAQDNMGRLWSSWNRGTDWLPITVGKPVTLAPKGIVATNGGLVLALVPGNDPIVADIARSTDYGATWTVMTSVGIAPQRLFIAPNGTLYASTGAGLRRSSDTGVTWSAVTVSEFDHHVISSVATDHNGYLWIRADDGLYRSTDNGDTWQRRAELPDPTEASAMIVLSDGRILLSEGSTMKAWSDQNGSFTVLDSLRPATPWPVVIETFDRRLLAGTFGDGVHRTTAVLSVPEENPSSLAFDAAFDGERLVLRYTLDRSVPVRAEIFDVQGRAVAGLPIGDHIRGEYEEVYTLPTLARGAYIVRLTAGATTRSKVVTVVH